MADEEIRKHAVAVIDIGSNSLRLVVYDSPRRAAHTLLNEKVMCGLGRGLERTGKLNADVSDDGTQVVFMDTADPARVWIVNIDGTGLRQLSGDCSCDELDPAFDPTGTKIAFVHVEGAHRSSRFGARQAARCAHDWRARRASCSRPPSRRPRSRRRHCPSAS